MSTKFGLIITDTSPLITLALADQLDILFRLDMPIEIPDAIYIEATRRPTARGASKIAEWINENRERVSLVLTDIGIDQLQRIRDGRSINDMGEDAAIEALKKFLDRKPHESALLLYEDSDIYNRRVTLDARIFPICTSDFLDELEKAGLIQSADFIIEEAARQGRKIKRQPIAEQDAAALEGLRAQLSKRR